MGPPLSAPPTPPVIRVVLLHTEAAVQDLCPGTVREILSTLTRCSNRKNQTKFLASVAPSMSTWFMDDPLAGKSNHR